MSLIGIRHGKDGIRRSKTVCDVRPDISTTERNGRTKKKNIFSKMLRSLSKLSKRNKQTTQLEKSAECAASAVLSSSGHGSSGTDSVLNESKNVEFENVCGLPGTSFGDNSAHTHGSDSASTGYVSEGSSRRMTSSLNNINQPTKPANIDLERENKLAKRAHAARFRSETDFVRQAVATTQNRRQAASDTDMDRDETDLETDEDRESDLQTEETDEPSDSFYTSDCSSTSYVTDEDSGGGGGTAGGGGGSTTTGRYQSPREITRSNTVLDSYRQRVPLRLQNRNKNPPLTRHQKLPTISRTMSAREFGTDSLKYHSTPDDPVLAAPPTAPSPALKARIMRLTLGEQIDTNSDSNDENKKSKSDEKSDSSPMMRSKSQVKEIASKFLNENHDDLHRPVDLKRTQSTNINSYKSRPTVLEKFAPKLEREQQSNEQQHGQTDSTSKPVGIRRTQSTKILDLAANLFQPTAEIKPDEVEKPKPGVKVHQRKLPVRSQTCRMSSPKAIQRRQSSDSFIRELLEMAKVEVNLGDEKPAKTNDFKSQISQASTKIARRKTLKSEEDLEKPLSCLRATKSTTVPSCTEKPEAQPTMINVRGKVEELDPFVKEILSSDSVPKAVKTKIREECWSLFNDPRTPKGVKQCILNTMLSKTQSE